MGHEVANLVDRVLPAGMHQIHWNARSASGFNVPSGTYLYRLVVDGQSITGHMTLIK